MRSINKIESDELATPLPINLSPTLLNRVIQEMSYGFAHHEIICDEFGKPIDYKFLYVNEAFSEFTGLPSVSVIGKKVKEVIPNLEERWVSVYGNIAQSGGSYKFDEYSEALDKHYSVHAFSPAKGQFVTLFSDISSERKLQTNMMDAYRSFLTLFNSGQNIVFLFDSDNQIYRMNQQGLIMVGKEESETFGLRAGEAISCIHHFESKEGCGYSPECSTCALRSNVTKTFKEKCVVSNFQTTLTLKTPSGTTFHREFLLSSIPIHAFDRDLAMVSLVDVTEINQLRTQILVNTNLATIGEISAAILHEINNPLGIIQGHSDLIKIKLEKSGLMSDTFKEYFNHIDESFDRVKSIVSGIKKSVRNDSNASTSLDEVVSDTIRLMGRLYKKDSIEIKENLNAFGNTLPASYSKIQQIIFNLLSNAKDAIKDTSKEEGSIELITAVVEGVLILICKDSGCGMNEENARRLFHESFTTKDAGKGSGIGSAVIKAIVEELNGKIEVRSTLGEGTEVRIKFMPAHSN